MKKFLVFALICLTMIFTACNNEKPNANTDNNPTETNQNETKNEYIQTSAEIPDIVPEKDFGGYNFRIYIRGGVDTPSEEFYVE
ncbi:MAG: hypothetical protein FWD23_15785, partial [Oscillospiraceae bacterium]|nr:hypothetical protein [Oscillospiraceae bacterium]